jgi:hypothetical protein
MKAVLLTLAFGVTGLLLLAPPVLAQYKAPSQYFPRNSPSPLPGGQPNPNAPQQRPPAPQPPKFKDVAVNSQFYFVVDTNRTYAWMKISPTTATNMQNGIVQVIHAETPVQR